MHFGDIILRYGAEKDNFLSSKVEGMGLVPICFRFASSHPYHHHRNRLSVDRRDPYSFMSGLEASHANNAHHNS